MIGLGYWGPHLVRNLQSLSQCKETVVFDLDARRVESMVERFPAVRGCESFDRIVADASVEAVVIATPVTTHFQLAQRALDAGKSVLVEKPLATKGADARRLVDLAMQRGVLVMAGHTFLYSPAVGWLKKAIQRGDLGDIAYVQSSRVNLGIHQSDVSVITDLAPHDISILLYWLEDRVVEVSASGRASQRVGPADVAFIDLAFESGCIANIHLSWLAPTKMRRMTLVGARQMAVYEDTNVEEPIKIYDKGVELPDPMDFGQFKAVYRAGDAVSPRIESWEPLHAELSAFLDRVQAGDGPDEREAAAIRVVEVTEAAESSLAADGRPITL